MLTSEQREKIRNTYLKGNLTVQSVSPTGDVVWKRILKTFRNEVPWETILSVTSSVGAVVLTGGHPVYFGLGQGDKVQAESLKPGDMILTVAGDSVLYIPVLSVVELPHRQFMYDITVEDWHRFKCQGTGWVLGNCPDKFYHFRPPEAEGNIGAYNRVFGQVWEDAEFAEYLEMALNWWNMLPPNTSGLRTIDQLVIEKPEWRTAVLWQAIVHATFALSANWVVDEFDYSIGGISLSLERSSKYEQLRQSAESQVEKAGEAKLATTKFTRGLQQSRYGMGVRSAFGPAVGRGVTSPRGFV